MRIFITNLFKAEWWLNLNQGKAVIFGVIFLTSSLTFIVLVSPNTGFDQSQYDLFINTENAFDQVWSEEPEIEVIHNKLSFQVARWLLSYPDTASHGLFTFQKGWSNWQMIKHLQAPARTSVPVVIHPYQLRSNMLRKMCQNLDIKPTAVAELMEQPEFASGLGFNPESIYCLFLPDTLMVYKDIRTSDLVQRLYRNYQQFWDWEKRYQAERVGLTTEEVNILASIVYAETKNPQEMPRIAGLYLNRLDLEMKLQADPTLVHAVGRPLHRVLKKHKRIRSPYNTYRNAGLPPGPIYTASKEALEAVLNYEEHDYLYFCAQADLSGTHSFSRTLEGHMVNARAYQKALNRKRIY